jgi:hypothetical protein
MWWLPLEIIPKLKKWREWPGRPALLGLYLPLAEPRLIPAGANVHSSAADRRAANIGYEPVNWPRSPTIVDARPQKAAQGTPRGKAGVAK